MERDIFARSEAVYGCGEVVIMGERLSKFDLEIYKLLKILEKSGGGRQDRTADLRVMNPSL
jgi:hypothetical protein